MWCLPGDIWYMVLFNCNLTVGKREEIMARFEGLMQHLKNLKKYCHLKKRLHYAPLLVYVAALIEIAYSLRTVFICAGSSLWFSISETIALPTIAASAPAL